jgi:hypothetical protein
LNETLDTSQLDEMAEITFPLDPPGNRFWMDGIGFIYDAAKQPMDDHRHAATNDGGPR